jgi:hypothetical protein
MAIAIATEWSLFQNCCETVEDDFRSTTIRKAEWQVRSLNLLLSGGRHLPALVLSIALLVPPDLIALAMHDNNHANRSECGRNDENQNPAFQRLNHARARR